VLAGLARVPELRTLRPRLAAVADACDPLGLQRALATAMLHADAPYMPLYFVDDHFLPYEGDKPVAKGWNTKRRHAQKGHADTPVIDYRGRVVCFTTGEPSGLSVSLPQALDHLRQVVGPDAAIMVGFDRGGSYPKVFADCRTANVGWVTYRRGELAPTTAPPARFFLTRPDGATEAVTLADETITLNDYGPCRQITLYENGVARLQILTSDTTASATALLAWLRCRWRIENVIKYLVEHLGVDAICDYRADLAPNTTKVDNPARTNAKATVKATKQHLADAERALAQLLNSDLDVASTNKAIPDAQKTITTAKQDLTKAEQQLKTIPAKVPANTINPDAQLATLHTSRRTLQMVLRLLAYNAELWLSDHLNTYLRDNDEFRAITRNLLHLGGTITYTPTTITVTLDRPATPKLTNALRHLLDELNTTPPHMPGDPRPITYQLAQN
jgi:Transposase protein